MIKEKRERKIHSPRNIQKNIKNGMMLLKNFKLIFRPFFTLRLNLTILTHKTLIKHLQYIRCLIQVHDIVFYALILYFNFEKSSFNFKMMYVKQITCTY